MVLLLLKMVDGFSSADVALQLNQMEFFVTSLSLFISNCKTCSPIHSVFPELCLQVIKGVFRYQEFGRDFEAFLPLI